nr:hypothetical protein [Tanacetum cinerariifolium]
GPDKLVVGKSGVGKQVLDGSCYLDSDFGLELSGSDCFFKDFDCWAQEENQVEIDLFCPEVMLSPYLSTQQHQVICQRKLPPVAEFKES